MLNLSMVAVPVWLDAALKSAQMSQRQILDVEAMSRITSRDDVAFYSICNDQLLNMVTGMAPAIIALVNSIPTYPLLADRSWENVKADAMGKYPTHDEYKASLQRIRDRQEMRNIALRSDDDNAINEAKVRAEIERSLINPCQECTQETSTQDVLPTLFYIRDNVYGIRFMQANPNYDYLVQLHRAISEVLETLCAHHPFSEVAKLPIFAAFVDICRKLPGFSLT